MQRDNNYREREGAHIAQPGKTAVENNNQQSGQTGTLQSAGRSRQTNTGSGESPAEIRAEIAQTRTEMSRTIDAIRDKLDPEHLKDQARDAVREATDHAKGVVREATIGRAEQFLEDAEDTAKGAGYTMMDTIRQNPIPAALVGVGLGWLLVNSRSQSHRQSWSDEGYYATTSYPGARERTRDGNVRRANGSWENHDDSRQSEHLRARAGDLAHRAGDTVGGAAGRTGDAVGDLADRTGNAVGDFAGRTGDAVGDLAGRAGDVFEGLSERAGETAGNLAGEARYRGGQVQGTFQQQLLNNPMALGAIALGVGAAVGMAAPKTQVEDRFMGETRDHLMEHAQSSIEDVQEKVQDGINQAGNTVQEKSQQNIQQAGQAADSKMQQANDTARQAVQQAGTAAQQTGSAMEQAGTEAKREAQNPSQQKTSSENQRK